MIDDNDFVATDAPEDDFDEGSIRGKRGPYNKKADAVLDKLEFMAQRIEKLEREKLEMQNRVQGHNAENEYDFQKRKLEEAARGADSAVIVDQLEKFIDAKNKKQSVKSQPIPTEAKVKPAVTRWIQKNPWITDPLYAVEAATAQEIDRALNRQWSNQYGQESVNGPEYMEELDNLLRQHETTGRIMNKGSTQYGRSVAGTSRNNSGDTSRPKGWTEILKNAQAMGKDISDPKVIERLEQYTRTTHKRLEDKE